MKLETETLSKIPSLAGKLEICLWLGEVVSLRLTPWALGLGPST